MKANVFITLKNGVLDPQGKAVEGALGNLGFNGIKGVRQGKFIEIELDKNLKADEAKKTLEDACKKLLANTVVENYRYELVD
ncbi:MAG: phosphoribosylformylglycinamidine synthase subunit PurS [Proteobacteria bacterium]|nr:phosphoribosylformylglycinamidine synthase subunit PurS [Pseudomonadota bacterium]